MKKKILPTLTLCLFLSCNVTKEISLSVERDRIMELHNLQRNYHFKKDSIAFANMHSDNFVLVDNGKITFPNTEEMISQYYKYFSSVEFEKWDDVTEPIIKFSDDNSMAYTIVDKIVLLNYKDKNGNRKESKANYAWTTIYKKYNNEWKIDCVTSTKK